MPCKYQHQLLSLSLSSCRFHHYTQLTPRRLTHYYYYPYYYRSQGKNFSQGRLNGVELLKDDIEFAETVATAVKTAMSSDGEEVDAVVNTEVEVEVEDDIEAPASVYD